MRRKLVPALAFGAGVLAIVAQAATATHVRPKGATPMRVSLVPAYKACTAPNRTHGAPLAFPSCSPPTPESNFLTDGTPDANGAGANLVGSLTLKVKATSPEDLLISLSISDVRCKPATSASVCNTTNAADGQDYSGEVEAEATVRTSDHYNGQNLNEAATVQDIPFQVRAPCVNTADTSTGGECSVTTSSNAFCPPSCLIVDVQRMVLAFGQVDVSDGGPDGSLATTDNTVFLRQGIFVP